MLKKLFIFSTILATVILLIIPFVALADGMAISPPGPYENRWDYMKETNQQAIINYENGLEKLILSIGINDENASGAVWLFPVPAEPQTVTIDILDSLPQMSGEDISPKVKNNLEAVREFLHLTQIYPFFWMNHTVLGNTKPRKDYNLGGLGGTAGSAVVSSPEPDVVVYEHIEKEGITSEAITAKTSIGLNNYFSEKGLNIDVGTLPILNNYIGKSYSFVASWINSDNQTKKMQRGILVTFPTEDLYYPLMPTSVYGDNVVPATIRIIGYVSPKIFSKIKKYTKVEYYDKGGIWSEEPRKPGTGIKINFGSFKLSINEEYKNFYGGPLENIRYTKIEINSPSKFFTDDLWIKDREPFKVQIINFLYNIVTYHPVISSIPLWIIISFISGCLAGVIVFRYAKNKKSLLKCGLLGLTNCLSLIGLLIATKFIRTKERDEELNMVLSELKQKGYFRRRRLGLFLSYIILPAMIFSLIFMMYLQEFLSKFEYLSKFYYLPLIILVTILIIVFFLDRIKEEDKKLFEEIKLHDYSTRTFIPKDRRKLGFVIIFSLIFLFLSWFSIKIIQWLI